MVFENAILFLRDALILRALNDTIKSGNSGRVVLVLKVLALYYRGCGRTKYAQEVLFLVHNLIHVWPAPLRYVVHLMLQANIDRSNSRIILNNWLVNPTGKSNAWVEVDLLQEHLNFWIKVSAKCMTLLCFPIFTCDYRQFTKHMGVMHRGNGSP